LIIHKQTNVKKSKKSQTVTRDTPGFVI